MGSDTGYGIGINNKINSKMSEAASLVEMVDTLPTICR